MKFILISCILLLTLRAPAQDLTDMILEVGELFQKGEYEKAIPAAEKAMFETEKLMGKDNMLYLGMLTVQAFSCSKTFRYQQAEELYGQLCALHKVSADPDHDKHYATCLNNLATLYNDMGLYEKSEPLFLQSAGLTRKAVGENDSAYAYSLNNLAGLYHSMGQYQKAEPMYSRAMAIRKKLYGENHNYATSMNNLATLYLEMGQAEKAEPLFKQAIDIWKKRGALSEADYAMGLNNLASVYEEMGKYGQAETLYQQARDIRKRLFGETHPDYAMCLNNLASMYVRMGQYQKAEALVTQARDTWRKVLGENHPSYATATNNLAALYRRSGTNYEKAEMLYKESMQLRKKILGPNHPLYADTENDLGLLYSNMGRYSSATPHLISSSRLFLQNMLNTFTILSEKEKGNFLRHNFTFTETHHSFLFNDLSASPELVKSSFNLQLGFKSLSLSDTRNMLESVRNSGDTTIKRIFNDWQANKLMLTKQYALPVATRKPDLVAVEEATELLEKELTRRSAAFRDQQKRLAVSTADVIAKLEPGEAAVEFVRFRLYRNNWSDSVIYAAYILKKQDSVPVFVPLFEERQLDKLYEKKGRSATMLARNLYAARDPKQAGKPTVGDSLYRLVWHPLEKHLAGIKRIAYSPAGKLYGIAFLALPTDTGQLLVDRYELQQYTSIRQVALRDNKKQVKPGSIVLFGDPSFTMDSTELVKKKTATTRGSYSPAGFGSRGGNWRDLPGTAEEVKIIHDLFENRGIGTAVYTRAAASEENLKSVSGPILHIATHGFFLPAPVRNENGLTGTGLTYTFASDPLLRSGLIMAGGNYAWSGKTPVDGVEDGIVTAYEIAQMNLGNTALVSLSACETGLGDIKGSEGVFGLQRSFKMAGVNKLLVSLWEVPDKETVELMTAFYTHWLDGMDIGAAFSAAQTAMRKKYPPYYWAAFVLVE